MDTDSLSIPKHDSSVDSDLSPSSVSSSSVAAAGLMQESRELLPWAVFHSSLSLFLSSSFFSWHRLHLANYLKLFCAFWGIGRTLFAFYSVNATTVNIL